MVSITGPTQNGGEVPGEMKDKRFKVRKEGPEMRYPWVGKLDGFLPPRPVSTELIARAKRETREADNGRVHQNSMAILELIEGLLSKAYARAAPEKINAIPIHNIFRMMFGSKEPIYHLSTRNLDLC